MDLYLTDGLIYSLMVRFGGTLHAICALYVDLSIDHCGGSSLTFPFVLTISYHSRCGKSATQTVPAFLRCSHEAEAIGARYCRKAFITTSLAHLVPLLSGHLLLASFLFLCYLLVQRGRYQL